MKRTEWNEGRKTREFKGFNWEDFDVADVVCFCRLSKKWSLIVKDKQYYFTSEVYQNRKLKDAQNGFDTIENAQIHAAYKYIQYMEGEDE